jgi:outer membrane protein
MDRMKRTLLTVTALSAAMMTTVGLAQAPAASAPAPAAQPAAKAPAPQAVEAKIALIAFEDAVLATNEGQRVLQEIQKKYEPKKTQIESLSKEVDTLKQQYQSASATLSDADKAARLKAIDVKEKELNRQAQDTEAAYSEEAQAGIGKVAQKMGPTVVKYVQQNGYTMLLDSGSGEGPRGGLTVMWVKDGMDISRAVVDAYNASSGIPPPTPATPAPTAGQPGATAPKQ